MFCVGGNTVSVYTARVVLKVIRVDVRYMTLVG